MIRRITTENALSEIWENESGRIDVRLEFREKLTKMLLSAALSLEVTVLHRILGTYLYDSIVPRFLGAVVSESMARYLRSTSTIMSPPSDVNTMEDFIFHQYFLRLV